MVKFQDLEWDVEFTNIRKLKTTRDLLSYSTGRVHPKETMIRKTFSMTFQKKKEDFERRSRNHFKSG